MYQTPTCFGTELPYSLSLLEQTNTRPAPHFRNWSLSLSA